MRSSCAGPRDPSSLQLTAPDALLKMSSTRTWSEPVQRLSTPGGRLGRQPYFAVVRQPLHHVHAAPSVRKLHSSRPAPSGGISIRLFPACDGEWVCWENRRLTRGQGGCNPVQWRASNTTFRVRAKLVLEPNAVRGARSRPRRQGVSAAAWRGEHGTVCCAHRGVQGEGGALLEPQGIRRALFREQPCRLLLPEAL